MFSYKDILVHQVTLNFFLLKFKPFSTFNITPSLSKQDKIKMVILIKKFLVELYFIVLMLIEIFMRCNKNGRCLWSIV